MSVSEQIETNEVTHNDINSMGPRHDEILIGKDSIETENQRGNENENHHYYDDHAHDQDGTKIVNNEIEVDHSVEGLHTHSHHHDKTEGAEIIDGNSRGRDEDEERLTEDEEAIEEEQEEQDDEGGESQENLQKPGEPEEEKSEKSNKLPMSKIKMIMKTDPDVNICSADAAFLLSRATEHFIRFLAEESFRSTKTSSRKTVQKRDLDDAMTAVDQLMFLDGAL